MVIYSKTLEHTRNYLVNIQVIGEGFGIESADLNYVAISFNIDYSGGSDFIHQKGRNVASVFAMQPTVSVNVRCYMTAPDFSVVISNIITNQQHILMKVGKLRGENYLGNVSNIGIAQTNVYIDPSATIYEIVGYMKDARITATAGEFILVEFTVNADEINEFDHDDLPRFEP